MRHQRVLSACLAMAAGVAGADEATYAIDSRHTFPSFEIGHLGYSTQRGRFNETSGTVVLDTAKKTGSLAISIKTASLDTGLAELEQELLKPDFFDPGQFPTIEFKSDKVIFKGDVPSVIEGQMTLHGVTKPLTLSIDSYQCGIHPINLKQVCGANASGAMKRSDFGLTKYAPLLPDDVKILIQVEAFKQ